MDRESDLKRGFRTTLIINWALVASLFTYALMVELIKAQLRPFAGFASGLRPENWRYIFYGAGIGAVVLVRLINRALLKTAPDEGAHQLIARLGRAAVMTAAVGEIPAVLGFALFLLTGFSRDFYILMFVSLFLEFMYFPRLKVWQDTVRERFPQQGI
jgi:hypothetical protein